MAAFTDIDRGTTPNDGTGDDIRTAFGVVNDNYNITANIEEDNTFSGDNSFTGFWGLGAAESVTISSGTATITGSNVVLSGEGAAADQLDTITGGSNGDLLVLAMSSDTITVSESGNIRLGASTRVLDSNQDRLVLLRTASTWIELSFANNN